MNSAVVSRIFFPDQKSEESEKRKDQKRNTMKILIVLVSFVRQFAKVEGGIKFLKFRVVSLPYESESVLDDEHSSRNQGFSLS